VTQSLIHPENEKYAMLISLKERAGIFETPAKENIVVGCAGLDFPMKKRRST